MERTDRAMKKHLNHERKGRQYPLLSWDDVMDDEDTLPEQIAETRAPLARKARRAARIRRAIERHRERKTLRALIADGFSDTRSKAGREHRH